MELFLIYLGKVALAMCAFFLVFLLLFQKQKHFGFNRIYLLASMAISYLIPLITFTIVKQVEAAPVLPEISYNYINSVPYSINEEPASAYYWYHYLFALLMVGVSGFLIHFVTGNLKALNIVRKSYHKKELGAEVCITKEDVHPFSFFNKVIISEKNLNHPNLSMILDHEKLHVNKKHTIDILIAELLFLLEWFNPFAWLLKDAVKNNLEFLTDSFIIQQNDHQTYQLAMVSLADKKGVAPFLTALNGSQLKSRIMMMKKKTENKFAVVKQLLLLPLLAILIMGLSNKEIRTEFIEIELDENLISQNDTSNEQPAKLYTNENGELILNGLTGLSGEPVNIKLINLPESDNKESFIISNSKIIIGKVTDENGQAISGATIVINNSATGTVTDISGNFVINIPDENSALLFNAIGYKEKEVTIEDKSEINVQLKELSKEERFFQGLTDKKQNSQKSLDQDFPIQIKGQVKDQNENIISGASVLIKDKAIGTITDVSGNFVIKVPEEESVIVFTAFGFDKKEIEVGDKKEINVTLEKKKIEVTGYQKPDSILKIDSKIRIRGLGTRSGNDPLYVVDGKITEDVSLLNSESISSISILKDSATTELYGEKAKNGVVLITTVNGEDTGVSIVVPPGLSNQFDKDNKEKIYFKVDKMPQYPGGESALRKFVAEKVRYPVIAQENGIQGKVYVTLEIDKKGKVKEPRIIKGVDPSLDKEAVRIVNTLPYWKPGRIDGKPVNTWYTVPVNFKLSEEEMSTIKIQGYGTIDNKNPLIVLDDVPQGNFKSQNNEDLLDKLNIGPEDIESINILKGESAISLFGEKAKDGVISITTKNNLTGSSAIDGFFNKDYARRRRNLDSGELEWKIQDFEPKALVVVDGVVTDKTIEEINPECIEDVDILKDKIALEYFGEKGKNGVIAIKTKNVPDDTFDVVIVGCLGPADEGPYYKVDKLPEFSGGKKALKDFLSKNIKYPEIALENGIHGDVYVTFIINKKGNVKNPEIQLGVDPSLDKEALRVVSTLPKWEPAVKNGKTVDVLYTVPVNFILQPPPITSELELWKFIAANIKYPVKEQKSNTEGLITVYARVDQNGRITEVNEESSNNAIYMDQVVVTALKSENLNKNVVHNYSKEENSLVDETIRIVKTIPQVDISEFKGKTIGISVKFVLQ